MKKILLVMLSVGLLFSLAGVASAKEAKMKTTTLKGWISESKCKMKGTTAAHAECTKKCIEGGASPVLIQGDQILTIDNPESIKGHEGQFVKVKGHVDGDKVHVMEVAMLKAPKAKGDKMEDMHK